MYCNAAADKMLPIRPAVGQRMPEAITIGTVLKPDHTAAAKESWPVMRAFAGEDVPSEIMRFVEKNGAHRWLCVSAHRILDERGALQYVISTFSDVTETVARKDRLHFMVESAKILSVTTDFRKRLQEKARLTVPSLADWCAIDILTENGNVERVTAVHQNPKMVNYLFEFEKRFPNDPEHPGGAANVIRTGEAVFVPRITEEMLAAGARSPEHLEAIRKLNLNSIMILPITANGMTLGAMSLAYAESGRTYSKSDLEFFQEFCYHMGVVLDNAHLFDEVRRRDKAKDIFLASLSHELRNPLAPIQSSLELLRMRDLPSEAREELDVIDHQFRHMSKLLNDLLDVSRFTKDRFEISPQPTELRRLVERSLRANDTMLRAADITLHFSAPSAPIQIMADETRLEQAVTNLISNASKFTPTGGSIWVDIFKEDDQAVIKIRDNGVGIHPDDLPKIFEMYYQATQERKHKASGLGIGLLLVQRILALHGGSVEAKSEGLGKGSEFTVRLPISEMAPAQPDADKTRGQAAQGLKILVVDDNVAAADSLSKLLNKLGAHTETAYSGYEVLSRSDLDTFSLFLLDVGMPQMDGYHLVQELRARGVRSPLVALTGYGLIEDKERAANAGFDAHLTKPVGVRELNEMFLSVTGTPA